MGGRSFSFSARTCCLCSRFHNAGWTIPHEVSSLPVSIPASITALSVHPDIRFPGESGAYRRERNRLLEAEIELRRTVERVAAQRRALPPGGALSLGRAAATRETCPIAGNRAEIRRHVSLCRFDVEQELRRSRSRNTLPERVTTEAPEPPLLA